MICFLTEEENKPAEGGCDPVGAYRCPGVGGAGKSHRMVFVFLAFFSLRVRERGWKWG